MGTETAFEVMARATQLAREGRDIIDLSIGQSDFRTPDNIVEVAVKALRDGKHSYTPALGIAELREAVATDVETRRGVAVDPANVLIVPGAKVTMFIAIELFGCEGAEIIYPNPGFPIYESLIKYTGATAVPVPILEGDGFAFSADAILELLTPKTRLIILNSPANPSGGVSPRAELEKLAIGLEAFPDVVILSDEIYSRILYDGAVYASPIQIPALKDRVILLDGWSKIFAMGGWRLGYGVWPESLIDHAVRLAVNSYSCVNTASQWAGIEALVGPQEPMDNMVATFRERRDVIVDELNKIPGFRCHSPGGAFYVFPNIAETGLSARELQETLLEKGGVAAVAGTSFGRYGENYIRFSYANSIENIKFCYAKSR